MWDIVHDLLVLGILLSPILVFVCALLALIEMYDSDPPSQILRRWLVRRERQRHTRRLVS